MTTTEENSPTAATAIPTIRRRLQFDAAFLAIVLTVFSVVTLATLSDYGITWDVYEYHIGDKFFYFFTSLDSDFLDFSRDNIRIYDQNDHPNFFLHSQYSRDDTNQWEIMPLINAITTIPIPVMVPLLFGIVQIGVETVRNRRLHELHGPLLLWLIVPALRVSVPKAFDYDAIRHWLEIVPTIGLISGIGAAALLALARTVSRLCPIDASPVRPSSAAQKSLDNHRHLSCFSSRNQLERSQSSQPIGILQLPRRPAARRPGTQFRQCHGLLGILVSPGIAMAGRQCRSRCHGHHRRRRTCRRVCCQNMVTQRHAMDADGRCYTGRPSVPIPATSI